MTKHLQSHPEGEDDGSEEESTAEEMPSVDKKPLTPEEREAKVKEMEERRIQKRKEREEREKEEARERERKRVHDGKAVNQVIHNAQAQLKEAQKY